MENEEIKKPDDTAKKEESGGKNDPVMDKDAIYGGVIVILVALLTISVLTSGFGIMPVDEGVCPVPTETEDEESQDEETTDQFESIPELEVSLGDIPPLGEEDAPVVLVEVSEFQCPYCNRFYANTEKSLQENEIESGKARLYWRDFPLDFHKNAMNAALAARCADEQDGFWEMHSMLFDNRDDWIKSDEVKSIFTGYAQDIGIDAGGFETCFEAAEYTDEISADMDSAAESGIRGTPGTFIMMPKDKVDMEELQSAYESLHEQYDQPGRPAGIDMYQDEENIIILVSGAYPYDVFSSVIGTVSN